MSRQVQLGHVLRNFSWLGPRQIRERNHGELIVYVSVDRGLEPLPRSVVMNAAMPVAFVDEPSESVMALIRLSVFQLHRSPHQVQARFFQQLLGIKRSIPLG